MKFYFRILVAPSLLASSICCANSQADEALAKNGQAGDNGGSWDIIRGPYPNPQNVPGQEDGLAQTLRESFELTCKTQVSQPEELRFQVRVAESGHVDVIAVNSIADAERRAQVYMNAFFWRAHDEEYTVDRFSGTLRIDPGKRLYQCQKIGGRKF